MPAEPAQTPPQPSPEAAVFVSLVEAQCLLIQAQYTQAAAFTAIQSDPGVWPTGWSKVPYGGAVAR